MRTEFIIYYSFLIAKAINIPEIKLLFKERDHNKKFHRAAAIKGRTFIKMAFGKYLCYHNLDYFVVIGTEFLPLTLRAMN